MPEAELTSRTHEPGRPSIAPRRSWYERSSALRTAPSLFRTLSLSASVSSKRRPKASNRAVAPDTSRLTGSTYSMAGAGTCAATLAARHMPVIHSHRRLLLAPNRCSLIAFLAVLLSGAGERPMAAKTHVTREPEVRTLFGGGSRGRRM